MQKPILYTSRQAEELQVFITDTFGDGEEGIITHETKSNYVRTDVMALTSGEGDWCFATVGMGARKMKAPVQELCRTELLLYASEKMEPSSHEASVLIREMQRLSKHPFIKNTFFSPGHMIAASEEFHDVFGFDAFVMLYADTTAQLTGLGEVRFLNAVPIYQVEWKRMMQESIEKIIPAMYREFGDALFHADSHRQAYPF